MGSCKCTLFGIITGKGWVKLNQTWVLGRGDEKVDDDDEFVDDGMQSDDEILELIAKCFLNNFKGDNMGTSSSNPIKEPNDNPNKLYTLLWDL